MNSKTPVLRFLFFVFCTIALLPVQNKGCQKLNIDTLISKDRVVQNLGITIYELVCLFFHSLMILYKMFMIKTPTEFEPII